MSLGPGLKNVLCLGACVLAVGAVSVHVAEPGEVANAHAAAGSGEPGVIAAAAIAPSPARAPTRGVARRLQDSESDPEESVPTPFPTNDDDWWGKHSKKATKKAVGQIALILIVVSLIFCCMVIIVVACVGGGITLCCISAQKNQQQPNPSATHEGTVVVEPPQPVVGTIVEQQPVVGTIVEPYANKA